MNHTAPVKVVVSTNAPRAVLDPIIERRQHRPTQARVDAVIDAFILSHPHAPRQLEMSQDVRDALKQETAEACIYFDARTRVNMYRGLGVVIVVGSEVVNVS